MSKLLRNGGGFEVAFGSIHRKHRMKRMLSQVSLAERLGVKEMTIANWEIRG